MSETKVCTKCGIEQDISCFSKSKTCKGGYSTQCKSCISLSWKQYSANNKLKLKNYKEKNKSVLLAKHREYNKKNREKINAKNSQYRKENRAKCTEYTRQFKAKDMEKWRKYALEYSIKNKERIAKRQSNYFQKPGVKEKSNLATQRYRALKRALPSTLTNEQWETIKSHFNNRCAYCGRELPLAQEHFIALSKGGEHTINNIIPSCISCNSSKREKDFSEWYPRYRYYSKKREKFILDYLNYKNNIQQLTLAI
jgi:5-methylcytosine-specific restriction endonuclease McrA